LRESIFSALSVVIQRHSILSAIPVDEDSTTPYFARLREINLEDAVTFFTRQKPFNRYGPDPELDSLLEKQHNINFKTSYGTLPFWRLLVLTNPKLEKEFVASFIYHHALGDGASGIAFQKHFHSTLAAAPAPLKSKIIYPPKTPLLPNLELLHPLPTPPPSPPSSTPTTLWTAGPIHLPLQSLFQSLVLPADLTQRLLHACRVHNTTITPTLAVLVARALAQLLPPGFTHMHCTLPVSIRHWLPQDVVTEDAMGVWIDALSIPYARADLLEGFPWEEARRGRDVVRRYLESGGQRINVARIKQRRDMRGTFLAMVGRERDSSFEISNLGVLRGGEGEGRWKTGRWRFSRSAFVAGGAFSIGVITGTDGCLCLGFSWQEGVIDRALIGDVVEMVRVEIEHLAGE
jgi:hypothetical protein